MDFSLLNKGQFARIDWGRDTSKYPFKKLETLFKDGVLDVQVFGFFFTKSDTYGLQPIAIADGYLLNLPNHLHNIISDLLKDNEAVKSIKDGDLTLHIKQYKNKKFNKVCYTVDFRNTTPIY